MFGQSLQVSIQWNINRTKGWKSIPSSSSVHHEHMKIKREKEQHHEVVCTQQYMAQHWWQKRKEQSAFHSCHLPFALPLHRALSHSKTVIQTMGPAQNPEPAKETKHKAQRLLSPPKANHGITAMAPSARRQKLRQFNWVKSPSSRSHWNFTSTFQLEVLNNTYYWVVLHKEALLPHLNMQFWCTGSLSASHIGGGKTNTFHRKCVIIFHISKYYTKAATWVVEFRQISSKINCSLLWSIYRSSSWQRQF